MIRVWSKQIVSILNTLISKKHFRACWFRHLSFRIRSSFFVYLCLCYKKLVLFFYDTLVIWKYELQTFGICAGCIGCLCPCFLFGKNAEILGSGTFLGSCVTHFVLWSLVNTACCLLTDGLFWGLPGCLVSCYACGYRRTLRSKYNLPVIIHITLYFKY